MTLATIRALLVLLAAFSTASAAAQDWPAKPVKFIVPFPPGGSVDPLARLVGVKLTESLKQQVIVENRPGASGSIGAAQVAKSPPDGYTSSSARRTRCKSSCSPRWRGGGWS